MLGTRTQTFAYRRNKRQGGMSMSVSERYLRSDIPASAHTARSARRTDRGPILVPDVGALSRFMELWEQQDALKNMVFCQTVLDALDRRGRTRSLKNIRRIAMDERRHAVVFANEVFAATGVEPQEARWYAAHLGERAIVVTLEVAEMGGLLASEYPELSAHFAAVHAATADSDMDVSARTPLEHARHRLRAQSAATDYARHWPDADIQAGLRAGALVKGTVRLARRGTLGVVERRGAEPIAVAGRAALNRACAGDTVVVRLLSDSGSDSDGLDDADGLGDAGGLGGAGAFATTAADRLRGVVVGIAQRSWRPFVATLQADEGGGARHLAVPVDSRVPKIRMHYMDAAQLAGVYFVVVVDAWPADAPHPVGHYVRTLGPTGSVDSEVDAILVERQIAASQRTLAFPAAVLREMPVAWAPSEADVAGRRDVRDWLVFSVDPSGCRDIDDAMSARRVGGHLEARARGTTVYLADRRFNMLPEVLSEDVCSLHAGVDRLAVSVVWVLDADMQVVRTWFGRTLRPGAGSAGRPPGGRLGGQARAIAGALGDLAAVMRRRRARRMAQGALELAGSEVGFKFDADTRQVVGAAPKPALETHRMVEEAMVMANEAVACRIADAFPRAALLRRHRSPTPERFARLGAALGARNIPVDCSSSAALAKSLLAVARDEHPALALLARAMATMAMQEAEYLAAADCNGAAELRHYGLALDHYTHFTSPIRRYADVVVHRQLLAALDQAAEPEALQWEWTARTALLLNERNRMSKLAQRDSTELFQALYIKAHLQGTVVRGVVSEVRENGLVVFVPSLGLRAPVRLRDREQIKDADVFIDGCKEFNPEPTRLSVVLAPGPGPGPGPGLGIPVASGRRRPQVYLTLMANEGMPMTWDKPVRKPGPWLAALKGAKGADQQQSLPPPLPAAAAAAAAAPIPLPPATYYSVLEKFAAMSILETSCDIQAL
ncbi:hypothetical protein BX661DRAFT_198107 [Kickxella alabastrina]|uniref:uncharacterized protein n=1 Tax=Kickxella alabastrina TaxID=61397 RepID=UPI00221F8684|nr:uncharacterized protein BX661DRAFT_198107 [Kickxella alabastrina]KAI7828302.1 hypothetical protein BX661DRAFT_198107 [Kickxella alabastrina]